MENINSPTDFLNAVLGREVVVKLSSGIDYKGSLSQYNFNTKKGTLACVDGYMNVAMENCQEYVDNSKGLNL